MKNFKVPLLAGVISLVGPLIWWLLWAWPYGISHSDWDVLGTSIKNVSGLYAVEAALMAAYIAWRTNQSRAEEAAKADYRDRIKWAVENFYNSNFYVSSYAMTIIESYLDSSSNLPISNLDKNFLSGSSGQIEIRRNYIEAMIEKFSKTNEATKKYFDKLLESPFSKDMWSEELSDLHIEIMSTLPGADGDISERRVFRHLDLLDKFDTKLQLELIEKEDLL